DPQVGDRSSVLGPLDFGIGAEITNQNDLVYASRHRRSPNTQSRLAKTQDAAGSQRRHRAVAASFAATLHAPSDHRDDLARLSTGIEYNCSIFVLKRLIEHRLARPIPGGKFHLDQKR